MSGIRMSDTGMAGAGRSGTPTTTLEQQYRRALRWYPSAWRAANEDAVLGTLLDAADDSPVTNSRAQIANLRAQAIAMRFGMLVPDVARHAVATHTIAAGTAFALVYFWFHSRTPLTPSYADYGMPADFGPFQNTGVILTALWLGAFVAAMVGAKHGLAAARATRVALALTLLATIALPFASAVGGAGWAAPSTTNLALLGSLALLALLGTPTSRIRLTMSTIVWLASFVAVYAINGRSAKFTDRYLWQMLVADIPFELIAITLLVVVILVRLFAGPSGVAFALLTASPWLLAWTVISTEGNLAELALVAAGALGAAVVLLLALHLITRSGIRVIVRRPALDPARIDKLH
jgi:hypothetical protein